MPPVEVQIEQIAHLKEKMGIVLSQNKVVFFMDCAAFSGEDITAGTKIYAKPKHKMRLKAGTDGGGFVSCLAAATA